MGFVDSSALAVPAHAAAIAAAAKAGNFRRESAGGVHIDGDSASDCHRIEPVAAPPEKQAAALHPSAAAIMNERMRSGIALV